VPTERVVEGTVEPGAERASALGEVMEIASRWSQMVGLERAGDLEPEPDLSPRFEDSLQTRTAQIALVLEAPLGQQGVSPTLGFRTEGED